MPADNNGQVMLRLWRKFGDALDALDLGGWICVACGVTIVGVTVLGPAWMDVRELRHENAVLRRQAALLDARRQNYEGFVQAVEEDDPLLLTRVAWHHLQLKPAGAQVAEAVNVSAGPETGGLRLDRWMRPVAVQLPPTEPVEPLADARLTRLIFGPSRPWVLAFGGWVLMVGLLLNPRKKSQVGDQRRTGETDR